MTFLSEHWGLVLAAAVPLVALLAAYQQVREKAPFLLETDQGRLTLDDLQLVWSGGSAGPLTLAWVDVASVQIHTTDQGPFVEDVHWVIAPRDGSAPLVVPGGNEGVSALLDIAPRFLDRFDHEAVIEAMGCTDNRTFMVWSA